MFLFKLKFLHTLFKFFVKSDEKGDFLDQIEEAAEGLRVFDCDALWVLFEGDHDVFEGVGLDQFIQWQPCVVDLVAIHVSDPLGFLCKVVRAFKVEHNLVRLDLYQSKITEVWCFLNSQ